MTLPSNKANMRLWVDALRSGDYKQGRHYLQADGKFCCLGVACQVAVAAGVPLRVRKYADRIVVYGDCQSSLPPEVTTWLGTGDGFGDVPVTKWLLATRANDSHGWSFERIADALDRKSTRLNSSHLVI